MSCVVYQTNKKTGVKYAYESVSYWDPEKKQPRSRRKYVGKVDPETGEIIYTNRTAAGAGTADSEAVHKLEAALEEKNAHIAKLEEDLVALSKRYEALLAGIKKLAQSAEQGQ